MAQRVAPGKRTAGPTMNYLNLLISALSAAPFNQASHAALGVWLRVMAHCGLQENGGRIVGAAKFTPRVFLCTLGVTKAEIFRAAPLVAFEGDDLVVLAYPKDQEETCILRRENARKNGKAAGDKGLKGGSQPTAEGAALPPTPGAALVPTLGVSSVSVREWNGIGMEGEGKASPAPPDSSESSQSIEDDKAWIARLTAAWPGIDIEAQLRKAHKKRSGDVERGWFEDVWLPGVTPAAPHPSSIPRSAPPAEPPGWRTILEDIFPGNAISSDPDRTWASVDPGTRARVLDQQKQHGSAA